jgi:hypothetical protein
MVSKTSFNVYRTQHFTPYTCKIKCLNVKPNLTYYVSHIIQIINPKAMVRSAAYKQRFITDACKRIPIRHAVVMFCFLRIGPQNAFRLKASTFIHNF